LSQLFPSRELRFFLTAPQACPYLPGRLERKVFAHLPLNEGAAVNDALTLGGFRRSQNIAYRPACPGCDACVSARIPVAGHRLSRSERRILERNADLSAIRVSPEATTEQFELLRRYLDARHAGGGMTGMTWPDYVAMVEDTAVRTHIVEYRQGATSAAPGALMACVLVDSLADGYSLVYSFFDPGQARRSLGSHIILDHISRAKAAGLEHVYLGYWVRGSEKMAYKARFDPLEILRPEGWRPITAEERAEASGA
jgi:arginyl-tRNA--protein-N-Asp/Glu arginylyltransferase